MPSPSKNMYWRKIPSGADVVLQGKPGSRYYVAKHKGKKYVIYWMGNEADAAQRFLDNQVNYSKDSFGALPRSTKVRRHRKAGY